MRRIGAIALGLISAHASLAAIHFHPIRPPQNDAYVGSIGISSDGTFVVGTYSDSTHPRPFRWTLADGASELPLLPGHTDGAARAASSDGATLAGVSAPPARVVLWRDDTIVDLATPAGTSSVSVPTLSANGDVVAVTALMPDSTRRAARWSGGGWTVAQACAGWSRTEASAISADGSTIVGHVENSPIAHAFRWSGGDEVTLLPTPANVISSTAADASAGGEWIVGAAHVEGALIACRWSDSGGFEMLGTHPGFDESAASGISADGRVIVGMSWRGMDTRAFIWDETHGMRDIAEILTAAGLSVSDWPLWMPTDISADGRTVVGLTQTWGQPALGFLVTLPEPAGLTLFGLALGIWIALRQLRGR